MPGGNHTTVSASTPKPSTNSVSAVGDPSKPCSSPRSAGVSENAAIARTTPEEVLAANSSSHEPSVNDSATMAAVALDSVIAAARNATPAITSAYSACPSKAVASSGQARWPPSTMPQMASADNAGSSAMSQATPSAASLIATSRFGPM